MPGMATSSTDMTAGDGIAPSSGVMPSGANNNGSAGPVRPPDQFAMRKTPLTKDQRMLVEVIRRML